MPGQLCCRAGIRRLNSVHFPVAGASDDALFEF